MNIDIDPKTGAPIIHSIESDMSKLNEMNESDDIKFSFKTVNESKSNETFGLDDSHKPDSRIRQQILDKLRVILKDGGMDNQQQIHSMNKIKEII